jgi:hypothetical protein
MYRLANCRSLAIVMFVFALSFCAQAAPFHHPGILNNQEEMEFIRDRVQAGAEPWPPYVCARYTLFDAFA